MNYIVFDLEWNQCPQGKQKENPKLPFEIIEIGAVKLNMEKEVIGEYHQMIKPAVYRSLHFHTKEIIGMNMRMLEGGLPFPKVAEDFLSWCGENPVFCTWGTLDLMELQRNLKFYQMESLLPGPIYYYDVQKLFAVAYEVRRERKSLSHAVEVLDIRQDGEFHHALEDARYTAKVLQRIPDYCIRANCSVDCYQNPKTREEEIYILYGDYEKYVSKEFLSKEEAMEDKEVPSLRCCFCHKAAKKRIRWFSSNAKVHIALGYCPKHGYLRGKIRMKQTDEGLYYVVKTIKSIGEDEARYIRDKQVQLRKKRQVRRSNRKSCD